MLSRSGFFGMVVILFVSASVGCSAQGGSDRMGVDEGMPAVTEGVRVGDHSDLKSGAAASCSPVESTSGYMGAYEIISVDRYGGSLSSEVEARERIGKKVVLSTDTFDSGWSKVSVSNPRYAISCYPVSREEGEVPAMHWGGHWSNFYGFGADREVVSVLEIHDPNDKSREPEYWYEIVPVNGKVQLWNMYDGWLYKMTKSQ